MTSIETPAPRLPWNPADPHAFYDRRRRDGDVVWDDTAQAWVVLGYDAARNVLGSNGWTSDPLANPTTMAAVDRISAEFIHRSMLFADGTTISGCADPCEMSSPHRSSQG